MNRDAVQLAWHQLRFTLEWTRLAGGDFQRFFEQIIQKAEPEFIPVTPSGQAGDHKSDGYIPSVRHHFQVYAPPTGIDSASACAKIREDFAGCLERWPDMSQWTFVWSTPRGGLPPDVIHLLDSLREAHPSITIDDWGREALWGKVEALSPQDRIDLLGFAPGIDDVTRIESADVLSMLTTLADRPIPPIEAIDFDLTEIGKKLERNGLGDGVRVILTASYGLMPAVRTYLGSHPDTSFPDRVAAALRDRYIELERAMEDQPDAIFGGLVNALATPAGPASSRYWAAAAIIGYSFELCDIFKR